MRKQFTAEFARRMSLNDIAGLASEKLAGGAGMLPVPDISETFARMKRAYLYLDGKMRSGAELSGGAAWLCENFPMMEDVIARFGVSAKRGALLPSSSLDGVSMPRTLGLMYLYCRHTDAQITPEALSEAAAAFTRSNSLTQREIWHLPAICVFALFSLCASVAPDVLKRCEGRFEAMEIYSGLKDAKGDSRLIEKKRLNHIVLAELIAIARKNADSDVLARLSAICALDGSDPERIIAQDQEHEALLQMRVKSCVESMRAIAAYDWSERLERLNPVDGILRNDPARAYGASDFLSRDAVRLAIEKLSRKTRRSEEEIAAAAIKISGKLGCDVSSALLGDKRHELLREIGVRAAKRGRHTRANAYMACVAMATAALCLFLLIKISAFAAMLLVPLVFGVVHAIGARICALLIKPSRLLRLDFSEGIPDGHLTLAVVPTLLTNADAAMEQSARLEQLFIANRSRNLLFCVLADIPDSKCETEPGDKAIFDELKKSISGLNEKYKTDVFCCLTRNRTKNRDGVYSGFERKRGALSALNEFLLTGQCAFEGVIYPDWAMLQVRFVLTIDSDTLVFPGDIARLAGIMAHPLNSGYGIIAPRIAAPLHSVRTNFQRALCLGAGVSLYMGTSVELYQDLAGEGIYCGKGLYDLKRFSKAVEGKIPENAVLSHDLLEGLYAKAALACDIVFYDGAPSKPVAYFKRLHRWTRGDWQLLPWIAGSRGACFSALDKWKMTDNIRRSLVAPGTLAAALALAYTGHLPYALAALLLYALLREKGFRALSLALLPAEAWTSLSAAVTALIRVLVTHKNMLEWTTAAQAEAGGAKGSIKPHLPQFSAAAVVLAGFFISPTALALAPFAALWLMSPVIYRYLERPATVKPRLSQKAAAGQLLAARRIYAWFEDVLREEDHFLPTDNMQISPDKGLARRTSPTNIGFAIAAHCAAYELGFIGEKQLCERVLPTVLTIEKLSGWHGHLYNWYDTATLEPLRPMYVSCVDSGNLAACMLLCEKTLTDMAEKGSDVEKRLDITKKGVLATLEAARIDGCDVRSIASAVEKAQTAQGLADALSLLKTVRNPNTWIQRIKTDSFFEDIDRDAALNLAHKLRALVSGCDFSRMYDSQSRLFTIGFDAHNGAFSKSHYDLLASEARLTSYLAIAKGDVPIEHYAALGRPLTAVRGAGGALLSWSGTMFEYLMPRLFLREYDGTLLGESCKNAVKAQIAYRDAPFWGKSESGCHAFDQEKNYQYQAFGIAALSLRGSVPKDKVVAPYASQLALICDPQEAARNLEAMQKAGLSGQYGHYEAIDYSSGKTSKPVYSYMAHHQGMGLLAIEQAITGGCLERFHSIPMIDAYRLLLQERMPDRVEKRVRSLSREQPHMKKPAQLGRKHAADTRDAHVLSGGGTSVITSPGDNTVMHNGRLLARNMGPGTQGGVHVFVRSRGILLCPTLFGQAEFFPEKTVYTQREGRLSASVSMCVSPENGALAISAHISSTASADRQAYVTAYFVPSLLSEAADKSHPAFADLFVETQPVPGGLVIKRRARLDEGDAYAFLACAFPAGDDKHGHIEAESSRDVFLGRGRLPSQAAAHFAKLKGLHGAQIAPCAAVRTRVSLSAAGGSEASFAAGMADSLSAVMQLAEEYSHTENHERAAFMAQTKAQMQASYLDLTRRSLKAYESALAVMLSPPASQTVPPQGRFGLDTLWKHGISGDLPVLCVFVADLKELDLAKDALSAHEFWTAKGIKCDLVLVNDYGNDYIKPVGDALLRLVRQSHAAARAQSPGGAYILDGSLMPSGEKQFIACAARLTLKGADGSFEKQVSQLAQRCPPQYAGSIQKQSPQLPGDVKISLPSGFGGFTESGSFAAILPAGVKTARPYANVLSNGRIGCIVTERGCGFTWHENSRERKLTPWFSDPVCDPQGELIAIRDMARDVFSPTAAFDGGCAVEHGAGFSRYTATRKGLEMALTVFVDGSEPVKCYLLELKNKTSQMMRLDCALGLEWVLGSERGAGRVHTQIEDGNKIYAKNILQNGFVAFAAAIGGQPAGASCAMADIAQNASGVPVGLLNKELAGESGLGAQGALLISRVSISSGSAEQIAFVMGCEADETAARALISGFNPGDSLKNAVSIWHERLSRVKISTGDAVMDVMAGYWLPYQAWAARILGRAGFYQAGGAYGFRDQLQDCVCLIPHEPSLAREQILRCCEHQFVEGDVQHWWHEPLRGVRTRITDDLLFLPWAVCVYVEKTGDIAILSEQRPFLQGAEIPEGKDDIYYEPSVTRETASVFEHCALAIERASSFGVHGLLLMGGGDWNDAMNMVGSGGKGESVWLSWFYAHVCAIFAELCLKNGSDGSKYACLAKATVQAIEQSAWDGAWYKRAFFDDGTPLGSSGRDECEIDLTAQCWAALSGLGDPERAKTALNSAYERLFDSENGIVRLLHPPFEKSEPNPGYIRSYTPGVRENGGQYTHAAAWFVLALNKAGMRDKAKAVLEALMPPNHADTKAKALKYAVEPYVAPADVYSGKFAGHGGWTWYTGSAGWLLTAILEGSGSDKTD